MACNRTARGNPQSVPFSVVGFDDVFYIDLFIKKRLFSQLNYSTGTMLIIFICLIAS